MPPIRNIDLAQLSYNWSWVSVVLLYIGAIIVISVAVQWFFSFMARRHLTGMFSQAAQQLFLPLLLFLFCSPLVVFLENFNMPGQVRSSIMGVAKIGTVVSVVIFLIRLIGLISAAYYRQLHVEQSDNLRARRAQTQMKFLEQLADVFLIFVGLATILLSFERFRNFGGSLLASAGLASVIVGFAAQKSIGNLIAGFQIAFTQPIRLGDAVIVESEWGYIEEITLTYVVVQVWDLRRLIVPINYFLEKPFQNWTRTSASLIGSVMLWVDYTVPIEPLRVELQRLVKTTPLWDEQTAGLQVVDSTDRAICLRVLVSARNSPQTWDLRCFVREHLIAFLQNKFPESLPKLRYSPEVQRNVPAVQALDACASGPAPLKSPACDEHWSAK